MHIQTTENTIPATAAVLWFPDNEPDIIPAVMKTKIQTETGFNNIFPSFCPELTHTI
jgi:hypothetical protein